MGKEAVFWTGRAESYLDRPDATWHDGFCVGRYGGSSASGADKNEDGLLAWSDGEGRWEFAVILDAHGSCESAELVIDALLTERSSIESLLSEPIDTAIPGLEATLLALFRSDAFRSECAAVKGECSCLIVCRVENMVWWLSIGDCMLFLLHPELLAWEQSMLNQRHFYEWVGNVNTFDLPVPCYSTGRRQLRQGRHAIVMATDGFLGTESCDVNVMKDWPLRLSGSPRELERGVLAFLSRLHAARTTDSTTLLVWPVYNPHPGVMPSE